MAEVDDNDNTTTESDRTSSTRGRDSEQHRGRLSYEELYARYKGAQEEAKSHRLNSDRFAKMADEAKAEAAKLKADAEKSVSDAKAEYAAALKAAHSNHASALESLKGEHTSALEALRAELTGKVSEAEGKATEALTAAQQRALQADLRVAAIRAGMVDLDGLKLLDMSKVEVNDNGDLQNGDEVMAALKEAKEFLFSKEPPPPVKSDTSSNTNDKKPDPKPAVGKRATEMSDAEFQQSWSHIMTTGKLPA